MVEEGGHGMETYFSLNKRLGICLPDIDEEWETLPEREKQSILFHWEQIRGMIPDRIASLEKDINKKQAQLSNESNFELSCQLNSEIAELASIINDLWLWYRTNQEIQEKMHQ